MSQFPFSSPRTVCSEGIQLFLSVQSPPGPHCVPYLEGKLIIVQIVPAQYDEKSVQDAFSLGALKSPLHIFQAELRAI